MGLEVPADLTGSEPTSSAAFPLSIFSLINLQFPFSVLSSEGKRKEM